MPMRPKSFFFVVLLLGILAASRPVFAQEVEPTPSDDEINRVARQMYCPVCENTPLDVCPTQACKEWRDLIRLKLSEGWTDEQIKDYFVAQYGDRVLAEPPRRGLNWLVYILPLVFIVLGAAVLFRVLGKMRKKAAAPIAAQPPETQADDRYLRELEEQLKRDS